MMEVFRQFTGVEEFFVKDYMTLYHFKMGETFVSNAAHLILQILFLFSMQNLLFSLYNVPF